VALLALTCRQKQNLKVIGNSIIIIILVKEKDLLTYNPLKVGLAYL